MSAADIGERVVKGTVAVSGLKTLEDVLVEGKSLSQSLDEALDDSKDMVRGLADAVALPNHTLLSAVEIVGNVLGDGAGQVAGVVVMPTAVFNSLPSAITDSLIAATEKPEDIKEAVGIPLSAALRQAYEAYDDKAKPIPASIATLLEPAYGAELLAKVRYVVATDASNIAGLINAIQKQYGESYEGNHAVTIKEIIVFAEEPSHKVDDLFFWAHEIKHVLQYGDLDFNGFAAKYTTDHAALEAEADEAATQAVEKVRVFYAALGL